MTKEIDYLLQIELWMSGTPTPEEAATIRKSLTKRIADLRLQSINPPIDQPKIVLTEWQKDEIRRVCQSYGVSIASSWDCLIDLQSVLNQPEEPKYQPKPLEPVLFVGSIDADGSKNLYAGVYVGMDGGKYRVLWGAGAWEHYDEVFPFDPSKVGTV